MKNLYEIIKHPLFTEKGTMLKESQNKLIIDVAISANKIEIKQAIEGIFKVKVEKVNTVKVHGKLKRTGRHLGRRSDRKKAIITLKPGEKLDFIEGS